MKKLILLFTLLALSACQVGEFTEKRNHLHELNNTDICEKNPQRCYNGYPW